MTSVEIVICVGKSGKNILRVEVYLYRYICRQLHPCQYDVLREWSQGIFRLQLDIL